MLDERSDLREGYTEIGDVRLHDVEAGDGPLIVLLHDFPDVWCPAETTHFLSLSFSNPPHQQRRSS